MTIDRSITNKEDVLAKSGLAGVEVEIKDGEIQAIFITWYNKDRSGSGWRQVELYENSQFTDLCAAFEEMKVELEKRGILPPKYSTS